MVGGVLVGAGKVGDVGNLGSILLVAFHRAVAEAKSEGGVGRLIVTTAGEASAGNGRASAALDSINLVVVLLAPFSRSGIYFAHQNDQGIRGGFDRCRASVVELSAHCHIIELGIRHQISGSILRRLPIENLTYDRIVAQSVSHL